MRISDWSSDVCSSDLAFAVDFDIGRKTQVILDVAVARQRIDRILALEFGKQFLRRLAKYVDQQIEAATMRHADDDLIDVTSRAATHAFVPRRNPRVATFQQIGRASGRERVCPA